MEFMWLVMELQDTVVAARFNKSLGTGEGELVHRIRLDDSPLKQEFCTLNSKP